MSMMTAPMFTPSSILRKMAHPWRGLSFIPPKFSRLRQEGSSSTCAHPCQQFQMENAHWSSGNSPANTHAASAMFMAVTPVWHKYTRAVISMTNSRGPICRHRKRFSSDHFNNGFDDGSDKSTVKSQKSTKVQEVVSYQHGLRILGKQ